MFELPSLPDELQPPKRRALLWQSQWVPNVEGRYFVVDTKALAPLPVRIDDADAFPADAVLVVMHPVQISELQERLMLSPRWQKDAYVTSGYQQMGIDIATGLIDLAVKKDPELNQKLGWR